MVCYCKKTEPYLLIYSVEKNKKHIIAEVAKYIAKEKKLRVYAITPEWFREGFECDRNFYFADPIRFLNLFLQADFTIVSSFHGTAFSVNLSKQFFSVSPDKFNSRIDSLLQMINIPDRQIIGNETDWKNKTNREIDFTQVQEIIFREREKSINFIKEHIH